MIQACLAYELLILFCDMKTYLDGNNRYEIELNCFYELDEINRSPASLARLIPTGNKVY